MGITGPRRGGYPAWLFTSLAVRAAGGTPVRITPGRPRPDHLDGLIIGGGADVAPGRYGAAPRERRPDTASAKGGLAWLAGFVIAPAIGLVRRMLAQLSRRDAQAEGLARDALELSLLEEARHLGTPTLGICRGAQLINVFAGGSLHQDLSGFYTEQPNPWTVFPAKRVRVAEISRLARTLGCLQCEVNSLHRQAIDRLGRGLRVVARDEHGVVQAIEATDHPCWLGVQWHPEYLPQLEPQRRLLRGLVTTAREHATRAAG